MSAAPALLGRDRELATCDRALDIVDGGRSFALGVLGEAGIGKSRLLAELERRAAARGHQVLSGRAAELERDVPFALWMEALDGAVASDGPAVAALGEDLLADLAVALPAVRRVTGIAPAATVERHRVARAIRAMLDALAERRPVAVLLDDMHWADPASADVIALLVHRPPDGRTLLALAGRTGRAPMLEATLADAARHARGETVDVRALSRADADRLLPPALGPATRERLYRESGGNPFFLEALSADGASEHTGGAGAGHGAAGVPRAVTLALAGEVAGLDEDARRLAQGAAVAGDPFDPLAAAAAAGMDEPAALAGLDTILRADLVRQTDDPRRFRFRHPLVRRAVYEFAGGGWRLAAHERAADALAARGATPAERAHHVERAARHGDLSAVALLELAAEQAAAVAPVTAAGWLETALRLLPDGDAQLPWRTRLLRARGMALASAGHADEARDALGQVLALLPAEARDERVPIVVMLAEVEALWRQRPQAARALLDAERAALGDVAPAQAAALTLAIAAVHREYGEHAATEALAEEARRLSREAGDRPLEGLAAATAADASHCRLRGERPEERGAVDRKIDQGQAFVEGLGDEEVAERLDMLLSISIARLFTGALAPALALAERGLELARRTRQGLLAPAFVSLRGHITYEQGLLDTAEADQEEARESAMITGNVQVAYWAAIVLSGLRSARGDVDGAVAHARTAWDLLGAGCRYSQAGYMMAEARLRGGDPAGAIEALEAFEWARPELWTLDRVRAADVATRVLLAAGRVDEADAWARRAPAEAGGRRDGLIGAIGARAEAAVLVAQDRAAEAAAVASRGVALADVAGAALWTARCATVAGEALAAAGDATAARRQLRRAVDLAQGRGALGDRDAALRVLRRLGDRPRPAQGPATTAGADGGPLAVLTPRERQVAELAGDGLTNAQIAARLHVSERTVEKHVSSALRRLNLSSRAGVAALLARRPATRT